MVCNSIARECLYRPNNSSLAVELFLIDAFAADLLVGKNGRVRVEAVHPLIEFIQPFFFVHFIFARVAHVDFDDRIFFQIKRRERAEDAVLVDRLNVLTHNLQY